MLLGLGGPVGKDLFIDDGGLHLAAAVTALVVITVDECGDVATGLGFGSEVPARQEFPLEGRVETLRSSVIESRSDPAHRLDDPQRLTGLGERGLVKFFV